MNGKDKAKIILLKLLEKLSGLEYLEIEYSYNSKTQKLYMRIKERFGKNIFHNSIFFNEDFDAFYDNMLIRSQSYIREFEKIYDEYKDKKYD